MLYNIDSIWKIQEIVKLKGEQYSNAKYWGIVSEMIFVFVKFFIIAVLNLLIFEKIKAKTDNKIFLIFGIVLSNILIILSLSYIQGFIYKLSYHKPIYLSDYLWKDIFIVIPSLSIAYIIIFVNKMKIVQLENSQLKELNTKTELSILKEQLNPHFMFNTLNSLSAVIRTSTKEASLEMVDDISSVYRYILDNEQTYLIHLKDEICFLNSYLKILKMRYNKGLIINFQIAEEFLLKEIPPLSLQILIENVVKHNKILSSNPICVSIKSDGIFLIVDNTTNIKDTIESHGIGLANLNKRFNLLFNKEIEIAKSESNFIVKLPILTK